jgi:hypothetical protein
MKLIITENKRNHLAINWLEDRYPELKKIKYPEYQQVFISDKGMFKMSYIDWNQTLYVKGDIWDSLCSWFAFDNDEVAKLLLDWGNKKFGFRAKWCLRVENI